jgi:metallo-beta-lactamase family protein
VSKNSLYTVPLGQQRALIHWRGAAKRVTGSMHLLEIIEHAEVTYWLIDAGTHVDDEQLDWQNRLPKGVTASMIKGIIITHPHGDHSFYTPRLYKLGFRGKVYMIDAACDLCVIGWMDCARILAANVLREHEQKLKAFRARQATAAERRNPTATDDTSAKRNLVRTIRRTVGAQRMSERSLANVVEPKPKEPLFTEDDARNALALMEPLKYNTRYELDKNLAIELFDADHMLGSATVHAEIGRGASKRTVNFGGNIGRRPKPVPEAQYRVTESTYGDRVHIKRDRLEALAQALNAAHVRALKGVGTPRGAGAIVVPAFSMERTQVFLSDIRQLLSEGRIPKMEVVLDSPMAIRVTAVYRKYPQYLRQDWQDLLAQGIDPFTPTGLVECVKYRKELFEPLARPTLIVTASGMVNAGRAPYHVEARGNDRNSTFFLIGFQAPRTTGEALASIASRRKENNPRSERPETIRLFNKTLRINATIEHMSDYSGHGDSDNNVDWLAMGPTGGKRRPSAMQPTVFLEHGEELPIAALRHKIETKLRLKCVVPGPNEFFIL